MPRYLAICSYDGTHYKGFQKQIDGGTIQDNIEDVLSKLLNVKTIIHASGRTDAQVHAYNQTFHFDTIKELDTTKFIHSMNCLLNEDIHIKSLKEVDNDFHARYSVLKKEYIYKLNVGEYSPVNRNYVYQYNKKLDLDILRCEIKNLIGTFDYSAFCNMEDKKNSYVRTIYSADVYKSKDEIVFSFVGNGFLKYQVRNMVGALIECSTKGRHIKDILNSKNRSSFGRIADACGLYLNNVYYK